MNKNVATNSWRYLILALGVSVCLIGAILMVVGESVLGENHSGIAALVGIIGIGLIGTFNTTMRRGASERQGRNRDSPVIKKVVIWLI